MSIELNESECEKIVKTATRNENVTIVKFNIEGFGNYLGFLGEYFRLKIDAIVNDSKSELNFFVKSLPLNDLKQRKMLEDTGIFRKEVTVYKNLLMDLMEIMNGKLKWCPRGYFYRDDLLVLDDLSLENYEILPFRFKFTQQHVEVTLRTLASFHCCSIVFEEKQKKSIEREFGEMLFETSVADIQWFHSGLQVIYEFFIVLQ